VGEGHKKGGDATFRIVLVQAIAGWRRICLTMECRSALFTFIRKWSDVRQNLALIIWAADLQAIQLWSVATENPGAGVRKGNYVQATYNMLQKKRQGNKMGFLDFFTPQINRRTKEVISRMRKNQIGRITVSSLLKPKFKE